MLIYKYVVDLGPNLFAIAMAVASAPLLLFELSMSIRILLNMSYALPPTHSATAGNGGHRLAELFLELLDVVEVICSRLRGREPIETWPGARGNSPGAGTTVVKCAKPAQRATTRRDLIWTS